MPTTRVFIGKDGKVIIEGINYIGDACIADLNALLQSLNQLGVEVKVEVHQRKPEAMASSEAMRA